MDHSHVRRFWLTLAVVGIAFVALLVAARPARVSAQSQAITIQGFAFSPASLQVDAGTTVTWTNNDGVAHTVTADDGSFDSGPIQPGGSFSHTFDTAGTVAYHCSIHPFMTAQIVVMAANNGGQATAPVAPVQTAVSTETAPATMTTGTGTQATAVPADTAAAGAAPATTTNGPKLPDTGSGSASSGFGRGLVVLLGGVVLLLALGASAARVRRRGAKPRE